MNNYNFFFDAESDGLYGKFLSIAAIVADNNGNVKDSFYVALTITADELFSDWAKENVFPYLKNAHDFVSDEETLLELFWQFWEKYRNNSIAIAYVPYPVETRLLTSCVNKNIAAREYMAPFPLYDLSTLVYAKYGDFSIDKILLDNEKLDSHDAMNDVKMMSYIWNRLF